MTRKNTLQHLKRLVGTWTTEATHPLRPGLTVHGTSTFEWLEGEQFLLQRSRTDHPDFPGALMIMGFVDRDRAEPANEDDDEMAMHYYDSRGVFRTFKAAADEHGWRVWNDSPGFSQRMTNRFDNGGPTYVTVTQLCTDGSNWKDDLKMTYRRA